MACFSHELIDDEYYRSLSRQYQSGHKCDEHCFVRECWARKLDLCVARFIVTSYQTFLLILLMCQVLICHLYFTYSEVLCVNCGHCF